ncbi:hypothetical protein OEG82_10330 [Hoeflea sp. J2-29]|uniref:Succinoglycan biosynthesis protein exoi n=2 Tax=Hoeflea ulvae TaxID=2983764 RepID=A0ABT3YEU1_9HYPH|nr:hypothetical protein [Hoeflea ulvae]MCY0094418.1 hypothetical protein [Hoeflea ulvae]
MNRIAMSVFVVSGLAFAAPAALSFVAPRFAQSQTPVAENGACLIKGNISITTGERIYHMPGQDYYNATKISPQHGERWFCSEAQARAAGWRKARL